MSAFFYLYRTELRSARGEVVTIVLALVAAGLWLFFRLQAWPALAVLGASAGLFSAVLSIWFLVAGFEAWCQEWKRQSIHWLLSLPVPASVLILAKLAGLLTRAVAYFLLAMAVTAALLAGLPGPEGAYLRQFVPAPAQVAWLFVLGLLPWLLGAGLTAFASCLAARAVPRFRWAAGALTFLILVRLQGLGADWLNINHSGFFFQMTGHQGMLLPQQLLPGYFLGQLLYTLAWSVLLFCLAAYLLARRVEA